MRRCIVKFKGLPDTHITLVKGGGSLDISLGSRKSVPSSDPPTTGTSDTPATGTTAMGRSESEVPLMKLKYLDEPKIGTPPDPDAGPPDADMPSQPVQMDALQRFFYDDQCCVKPPQPCQIDNTPFPPCCAGSECVVPSGASSGTCVWSCLGGGAPCPEVADCCTGLICGSWGQCMVCSTLGKECGAPSDCCPGPDIICGNKHVCRTCAPEDAPCDGLEDCCPPPAGWIGSCDPTDAGGRVCKYRIDTPR